jgi:predicted nuclease of predicted toxin-antitoxin system
MNIKFLLDENVPYTILKSIKELGFECSTIQELGWNGFKDKEIAKNLQDKKLIFITRDKDFTFIWKKYGLRVHYIAIKPAIFESIRPKLESMIKNWKYNVNNPFLIMLQNNQIRYWEKK